MKKTLFRYASVITATAGAMLFGAKAFAVSQFAEATNAATLVATDLTTDLLALSIKLVILAGGLFVLFLIWRRSRTVANSETRIK